MSSHPHAQTQQIEKPYEGEQRHANRGRAEAQIQRRENVDVADIERTIDSKNKRIVARGVLRTK